MEGGKGNQQSGSTSMQIGSMIFSAGGIGLQKRLRGCRLTFPGYATDHTIVRVDDIALALVVFDDAVVGCKKLFSFLFATLKEFLAGAPCHAMKNDSGFILWHLTSFVNDSSCAPGVVDQLAGRIVALSVETLGSR